MGSSWPPRAMFAIANVAAKPASRLSGFTMERGLEKPDTAITRAACASPGHRRAPVAACHERRSRRDRLRRGDRRRAHEIGFGDQQRDAKGLDSQDRLTKTFHDGGREPFEGLVEDQEIRS